MQQPNFAEQSAPAHNRRLIMTVMLFGAFVAILNETLLNVAIPHIMRDFHITASSAQWLTTAYLMTNGVLIPVTAFLVQKFSTKGLFVTGMGLFAAGTLIAGLAPHFYLLLLARVVQASGAAIVLPLLMNVILALYSVDKRGAAMGLVGLVITFAPAIGPTLSGWLISHHTWHILFFVVLPFALLDIVIALRSLDNVLELTKPRIDISSVILSSFGFGGLLFGFSVAGSSGWHSTEVWASLAVGLVALGTFIARQLRLNFPMLEFRVFRYPIFSISVIMTVLVFMTMFSAFLLIPLYLQNVRGFTPFQSGLLIMPGAIAMGIMSPISGRIFDKVGGQLLGIIGSVLLVVAMLRFTVLSQSTSYLTLMLLFVLMMLGMSLIMMPVMTAGLNQLPRNLYPHGTAMSNTLQQVSGAIGTALLVTIMTQGSKSWLTTHLAHLAQTPASMARLTAKAAVHGMDSAFLAGLIFAGLALILSFFIRGQRQT